MNKLPFNESYKGAHIYTSVNGRTPLSRPIMVTFYPPEPADDGVAVFSHTIWMSPVDAIGLASVLVRAAASHDPDSAVAHVDQG